jgi:hypothetical protein
MKLIAVEIKNLLVFKVAKMKPRKLINVIVIERMEARFKTMIVFLVCCIFIIIRQKKIPPGIPRPLKSIPSVESNLSSANPNGKINCPLIVENTQTNWSVRLTEIVARI